MVAFVPCPSPPRVPSQRSEAFFVVIFGVVFVVHDVLSFSRWSSLVLVSICLVPCNSGKLSGVIWQVRCCLVILGDGFV